jgi:hypothetical protein
MGRTAHHLTLSPATPKRLDRVIQAGLVGAAVAKIVLNQFGRATP